MHISLRPLEVTDTERLALLANNARIARNLTDQFPHPYTDADAQKFISMTTSATPVGVMAIVMDGDLIGCIGLHPLKDVFRLNAELGYWIGEPYWGKGIMPVAIDKMVSYGFKQFEINRIFARPYGSNLASQRVLEKAGFKLEARFEHTIIKNGVLEDELIYAKRRGNE